MHNVQSDDNSSTMQETIDQSDRRWFCLPRCVIYKHYDSPSVSTNDSAVHPKRRCKRRAIRLAHFTQSLLSG